MNISFTPGGWENAGLTHAYSWRFAPLPVFRQEADCIANSRSNDFPGGFEYMGLITDKTYSAGTRLSARMSFENLAAPMLLISFKNEIDEQGALRVLDYYEIVVWRNGMNVWRHFTKDRVPSHYLALGASFPLAEGEIHIVTAELRAGRMLLDVDGHALDLYTPDLPERVNLGYAACEGICRLYDMRIDEA